MQVTTPRLVLRRRKDTAWKKEALGGSTDPQEVAGLHGTYRKVPRELARRGYEQLKSSTQQFYTLCTEASGGQRGHCRVMNSCVTDCLFHSHPMRGRAWKKSTSRWL